QVTGADKEDRLLLLDLQHAGDPPVELGDVITDAALAEFAKIGEVLAKLGRADTGEALHILGGDGPDALILKLHEAADISRQALARGQRALVVTPALARWHRLPPHPATSGRLPCG